MRWPISTSASQPPTPAEPEVALVVDVGDDQADLVDVADDRDHGRPPGFTAAELEPMASLLTSAYSLA